MNLLRTKLSRTAYRQLRRRRPDLGLPEWNKFKWDYRYQELFVEYQTGSLEAALLADRLSGDAVLDQVPF